MFEFLPHIEADEYPRFAAMGIRDFPHSYVEWFEMIRERHRESIVKGGAVPKMICIRAIEYAQYCDLRGEDKNLKSLERLVEEKAAGTNFGF